MTRGLSTIKTENEEIKTNRKEMIKRLVREIFSCPTLKGLTI